MTKNEQLIKMNTAKGFIAALDQSGGSTPKALQLYGINETAYSNKDEMFDMIHKMRTRIMKSPAFSCENIIAAILFDNTLDKTVDGVPTSIYLLNKGILPILKIDLGLAEENNNCQLMKPIVNLDEILKKAVANKIFGTKMRSVIKAANPEGIKAVVAQQFEIAKKILSYGIYPIIEPEVDINTPNKAEAEALLKTEIFTALKTLSAKDKVIFKLTLPTKDNFYSDLTADKHTIRVVALSGGYSQADANKKLAKNKGIIASFSRALTEGLSASQTDAQFNKALEKSIKAIAAASNT